MNGVAAHALDFDDTIQGLTTHPSCHLVPALLALAARTDCSGPEFLTAYLVGLQAEHLLAASLGGRSYRNGWHTTQAAGTVATAVASSRLLRLDRAKIRVAIGAAASAAAGLRANFGSMVKPLHAGRAARNGVEAALLARAGFTAADDALQHRFGLVMALTGQSEISRPALGDLTGFPVVARLAFKPYPCCGEAMGAVEAATILSRAVEGRSVDGVEVRIGSFAREMLEFDTPTSADEARFSATYCVSRALETGQLTVDDFSEEALAAADPSELASIDVLVDPDLGHERAADVRVLVEGEWLAQRVVVPRGDPTIGFSEADVTAKWHACVDGRLDPSADLLDRLLKIQHAPRVGDLVALSVRSGAVDAT